jgi:GT2 family glycosyltransferase
MSHDPPDLSVVVVVAGVRVHASTGNACYTRSLWERIGPFPRAVFCGDGVLAWRAAQAGHVPRFVPEAVVRHHHDLSVAALCQQRFRRGQEYGQVRMEREQAARLSLLFSPAALPLVMGRAGRNALRAGWTARFLATVPGQVLGHALWALGEFSAAMCPAPSQPRQPGSLP